MSRIPPLKSVQAFDAAARHLSFSRAAEELCVTQSAVSHQIKLLEDFIGKAMFLRKGKQVFLTRDGDIFKSVVADCFERLAAVTNHLVEEQTVSLRVIAQTTFATQFLAPRLGGFSECHPDIQVSLDTEIMADNFDPLQYDILLGAWPTPSGFTSVTIGDAVWYPVCTPGFALTVNGNDPMSLLSHPLFSAENGQDWTLWMHSNKVRPPTVPDIRHFNLALIAYRAMLGGHGIALANDFIAADDITDGKVTAMRNLGYTLPWGSYSVHYRTASHGTQPVRAFVDWLFAERDKLKTQALKT